MNEPIMSLQHVGYSYRSRARGLGFKIESSNVLNDISFSIHQGETLGVIGSNGAGKSTLLRLIANILLPDSGRIIQHKPLSISLLTLQIGFSPELCGVDNAIMSAMLLGYSKSEIMQHLLEIIDFTELGDRIFDPIKTYSTGMRARLGFAVAMKMSPDILLLDEVLGVGDEAFRKKSTEHMKQKMTSGQTVIFVSHNAGTMLDLCTRALWIDGGRLRLIGETKDVIVEYQKGKGLS